MTEERQQFERTLVGTVPFEVTNLQSAIDYVVNEALARTPVPVRLANAYCVAVASKDLKYRGLLSGEGVNFPDGTPVVWAMRGNSRLGSRPGRVRGPSLFVNTIDQGRRKGIRHYFLGTTPETLELLVSKIEAVYPGTIVAGAFAPPFGELDDKFYESCVQRIEPSEPHILWVALGSPKQDYATSYLARSVGVPCVGVGAAFDFVAGTAKEAPRWMQDHAVEWLYRFATEPGRLWRRYLFGNIMFAASVAKSRKLNKLGMNTTHDKETT